MADSAIAWDAVTGVSSAFIALCALGYTIWQGKKAQNHNKLSFRPHLTSWGHRDYEKGIYVVELMNNGIGPALIESFTVKVDGKVIPGSQTEPIERALKILFPNAEYQSHREYMAKGYSMAPKEKRSILVIQFSDPNFLSKESIEHALNRADLIVKYKSFYNEEFKYSSEDEKRYLGSE